MPLESLKQGDVNVKVADYSGNTVDDGFEQDHRKNQNTLAVFQTRNDSGRSD